MTIARKLWLGFGGLILIFLAASLIVLFSERTVENTLDEIVNVEEPTSRAAYEMEINAVEISRDVLEYLETGDPQYRNRFEDDRTDFEEFQASHAELVDTPTGREHVEQIDPLYDEYVTLGESLMDKYDEQGGDLDESVQADLQRFAELEASMDDLLDEEVQPWSTQQLQEAEKYEGDTVQSIYRVISIMLLLGLLVGGLAAYLINRGIIHSVYQLKEGARRVGEGDLDRRIEVDTHDELGTVAAAFNEMLDKRQEVEARVRASEGELRALFAAMNDVIFVLDSEGRYLRIAPTNPSLLYKPPEDLVGKTLHEIFPQEQANAFYECVRQALETGQPVDIEYSLPIGEQETWFAGTLSPMTEDQVIFVARDITERKQAEEALRKSEARTRAIVETAPDAIITMTTNGLIRSLNSGAERIFGYSAEEAIGQPLRMLMPERFRGPHEAGFRRYLKGGEAHVVGKGPVELAGLRKNGEEFPLELSLGEMREENEILFTGIIRDVTERKQAEEELQESQKRFEQILNQSVDALWVHDETGRIVDCNTEAYRSLGYSREEMLSISIGDISTNVLSQEERGAKERDGGTMWERAIASEPGTVAGVHYGEHRRKDGTTFPVEVRVSSVDYAGKRMILASARDITERKKAEEEIRQLNEELEDRVERRTVQLRESEERYRLVVSGANDGIWDWDIRTGEVYWSQRFSEMLDLSHSEVEPSFDLFVELIHPDDRQRVLDAITAHLERNVEYSEEFRARHSSGEYIYVMARGRALRDEDGTPIRMAGSVSDITERKKNEVAQRFLAEASAELASSLDYHTTLTSMARLAVPHLADWCVVDVTEEDGSIRRLTVYHEDPEKVALAHELQERYAPPPDAPYGLPNVLRTGEPEMMEEIPESLLEELIQDSEHLELIRKLGLKSYMIVPLTARGRILGVITFVMADSGRRYDSEDLELAKELARRAELAVDNARLYSAAREEINERERAEEEIRQLNQSLEQRVEERTAQLENTVYELEKARVAAEAANQAKGDFLANMSHEIRTPMNGVLGMTELLLGTGLDDEQREYTETVRRSAENLLTIINDILDFSKIEAGQMLIETIDFDLRVAVEETVALLAERVQDKGLELSNLIEYDVPTALRGDPGRIRQVLTNLIDNAFKFTEEGEIIVRAKLLEEKEDVATIHFEVRDTGIGMTEEEQRRIFQSFSQADASTTRRYGGTGLGLAISTQLVELMGGEIGVESEPGTGSTFFFTLPLKKQPADTKAPSLHPTADLRDLRALIVDDNSTNRQILHKQLSSWNIENEGVENGSQALSALHSAAEAGEPYDLVILDMEMPEINGMQLARMIKDDSTISQIRLVLLTSAGRRGEGEEARQSGIEAYLPKPVKQSELYDTLITIVSEPAETIQEEETQLVTRHTLREWRAGTRARLLVVEDNPVNQRVAVRTLEKLGYRVDVASNGREALEALSQSPYAAVLMDVQMPEMDGYEATAEIRRREESEDGHDGRHTPVIAMTANAMQGDREKALDAGMDDYVAKPVKSEELDAILKRWVSHEGEAPEPEASRTIPQDGSIQEDLENPLDEEVLSGLRELGDADLLAELVEVFFEDVPPRLAALRKATESGDAKSVERVAHTLKGSCGNMSAWRMAEICAELQETGVSGDLARAPDLLEQLEAEFGRVRPALEAEVARSQD